ncbi:unnamed protein product [Schistosoma turkestanicum]|nr:unnamed protein product [Schistosoma turkestanicum]
MNCPTIVKQSFLNAYEKLKSIEFSRIHKIYDNLTGLDRVRSLHVGVVEAEKNFIQQQNERRACQTEVFRLEEARNRINLKLDSVSRSDATFLELVTELHELSRQHQQARDKLTSIESSEQASFKQFSSMLRHSQAEERIQASRMQQWTVGFSLVAGLFGFGATWMRFRKLDKERRSSLYSTATTDQTITEQSFQDLSSSLHSFNQRLKKTLDDLNIMKNTLNDSLKTMKENLHLMNRNIEMLSDVKGVQLPVENLTEKMSTIDETNIKYYTYGTGILILSAFIFFLLNR